MTSPAFFSTLDSLVLWRNDWIFSDNVVAVARQVGGEVGGLARHHPAEREDDAEGGGDDQAHRQDAGHFDLAQQQQRRREHEAQQNGERQRQQHLAPDIECGDDDDADQQALQRGRAGVGRGGQ